MTNRFVISERNMMTEIDKSPRELPDFPVDDFTLDQLEHALNTAVEVTDDGEFELVGGEFTLSRFLQFMSGYDPERSSFVGYVDGLPGAPGFFGEPTPMYEHWDASYSESDVIRALIAEVRRLRTG
jgi:hypothetical protein